MCCRLSDAGRVAAAPTTLARSSPRSCLYAIGSEPHAAANLNTTIEAALNRASRDGMRILLLGLNEHMQVNMDDADTDARLVRGCRLAADAWGSRRRNGRDRAVPARHPHPGRARAALPLGRLGHQTAGQPRDPTSAAQRGRLSVHCPPRPDKSPELRAPQSSHARCLEDRSEAPFVGRARSRAVTSHRSACEL